MTLKCSRPGCNCTGPLYIHGRCHPDAPTWAIVDHGVLTIECAECKKLITKFKLAKEDHEDAGYF